MNVIQAGLIDGDPLGRVIAVGRDAAAPSETKPRLVQEVARMVTRRRTASKIHVLPPDIVPISPEDYQKAVTALAQMMEQWWRRHHDDEPEQAGHTDNAE